VHNLAHFGVRNAILFGVSISEDERSLNSDLKHKKESAAIPISVASLDPCWFCSENTRLKVLAHHVQENSLADWPMYEKSMLIAPALLAHFGHNLGCCSPFGSVVV
jgi:hypothetical protein